MSKSSVQLKSGGDIGHLRATGNGHVNSRSISQAEKRRSIPSVEKVLHALGPVCLPRNVVLHLARKEIVGLRRKHQSVAFEEVVERLRSVCDRLNRQQLRPVINGTGVILHTNLGRAPLGAKAIENLSAVAGQFNNLEYDLTEGARGTRAEYVEICLAVLCGAEKATIVNNCAAALVLALRHFTRTRSEVIISRGELVEIGGGFRIPEILEASGGRLREVGTTNKTSLKDYVKAIGPETGLILKVHRSNFVMSGFVESPSTCDLAVLARKKRIPIVEDLGSGAVAADGLVDEPTPAEILKQGVDLVTFSGDKLFGGPQAGIIAGRGKLIAALKEEPFYRALRCDKLVLAALEATASSHLGADSEKAIPLLSMLKRPMDELRARAEKLAAALGGVAIEASIGTSQAQVGGGSLPHTFIPSIALQLRPARIAVSEFAKRMRLGTPAVVGCVSDGSFKIDLRTVFPAQDTALVSTIVAVVRNDRQPDARFRSRGEF